MSIKLTRDLFNSAERVEGSGQIKNTLQITVQPNGSLTDNQGQVLDVLPYGNRGDHCVTKLEFTLPQALQEGYDCFVVLDLKEGLYLQHCTKDSNLKAIAWITDTLTFSETLMLNTLFVCVESEDLQSGNIDGDIEIFVTDEFVGEIKNNFLVEGWHTGTVDDGHVIDNDVLVNDNAVPPTQNPTQYTPMTWYNGVTELNAANMNNIMVGIDELKEGKVNYIPVINNMTVEEAYNLSEGKPFIDQKDRIICISYYGDFYEVSARGVIWYGNYRSADIGDWSLDSIIEDSMTIKYYCLDLEPVFLPDSTINVEMQHSYQVGDLIFVHIKLNRNSAVSSTGIYTIGTLTKIPQHEHLFVAACYNGSTANSDVAILETDGELKLRFTGTTSGSTYKWDLAFFFSTSN